MAHPATRGLLAAVLLAALAACAASASPQPLTIQLARQGGLAEGAGTLWGALRAFAARAARTLGGRPLRGDGGGGAPVPLLNYLDAQVGGPRRAA